MNKKKLLKNQVRLDTQSDLTHKNKLKQHCCIVSIALVTLILVSIVLTTLMRNAKTKIKVRDTDLSSVSDLSSMYGATTNYKSASSGELASIEWQLFYDDTENIYLIASDYVPGNTLPNELLTEGQYTTYCRKFATYDSSKSPYFFGTIMENTPWSDGAESNAIKENPIINIYSECTKRIKDDAETNKNEPNMKAVAYMMDTSKWSDFAGGITGAYAIGGPTAEMFLLSYYTKHNYEINYHKIIKEDIHDMVNMALHSESGLLSSLEDTNSDNMWIKVKEDKAYQYWLASISVRYYSVGTVDCHGRLSYDWIAETDSGFRPVVVIPKSSIQ